MAMLAMTILVRFSVLYGSLDHLHTLQGPTCGTTLQPSHLAHIRPASSLVWTVHGAFYVPLPRINQHMAMTITMRMVARFFFSSPRSQKGHCQVPIIQCTH